MESDSDADEFFDAADVMTNISTNENTDFNKYVTIIIMLLYPLEFNCLSEQSLSNANGILISSKTDDYRVNVCNR